MLLHFLVIPSDFLSLLLRQRNDILGRHFEAVGILVVEDGRFFPVFGSHAKFRGHAIN